MTFNFLSFGYIPTGHYKQDLIGKLRGVPNMLKRLQARKIMDIVTPKEGERILDFGCGGGFFTFEFARRGAHAVGLDIIELPPHVATLKGSFNFVRVSKDSAIPFPESFFNKVFLSEVLVVLSNPAFVLKDLSQRLKKGGQIVIVNTIGRIQIEEAYRKKRALLRFLKSLYKNCPPTYEEFCSFFFKVDGLDKKNWYNPEEIKALLNEAGIVNIQTFFPFKELPLLILYWIQFWKLCSQEVIFLRFGILRYLVLEMLKLIGTRFDPSTVVLIGEKE
jgi:2-polyprenyl-3-methyl-5-hydroxy-6-metoxy-1,4-benzoquinol methylase